MKSIQIIFIIILIMFIFDLFPQQLTKSNILLTYAMQENYPIAESVKPPKDLKFFPDIPPDDPLYMYQWNLDNIGKEYKLFNSKLINNFGIQAERAWKAGASGEGVKIAILSTGVAYEDWTDPETGYAYKKVPDFANIIFDTENARDFSADPNSEKFYHANDDIGSGTAETDLLAASINNSLEFAGLAYKVTILPIKVLFMSEEKCCVTYSLETAVKGVYWAADHGADIICVSTVFTKDHNEFREAIKYAVNTKGAVVIGNPYWTSDLNKSGVRPGTPIYPGAYPECIAVGGTNFDGTLSNYVNYGKFTTVYAPHGNFTRLDLNMDGQRDGFYATTFVPFSTNPDGSVKYSFNQDFIVNWIGTVSPPVVQVAGVAAFVIQKHPDWTPDQIKRALVKSARKIGKTPLGDDILLLDAYGAYIYNP